MTDPRTSDPTAASSSDARSPDDDAGNPVSFEAAMTELEALVQAMEGGALSLEQSLDAYKRGAALVASCRESLAGARQQVRILEADLLKVFDADADAAAGDEA
ncbi:MAG: exodeoxyribonuclease VII small subunit [Burkholderiaceae bacterium]